MIGNVLKGLGIFAKAGIVSAVVASIALPASAEGLNLRQATAKSRAQQFDRQKQLMDSRLAKQYQQSKRLRPTGRQVVNVTTIELSPTISTKAYSGRRSAYMPHAQAVARKYGIPEALFLRLVNQESGWNPNARSHKGAMGLAQLMPGTAAKLGVNPGDPVQNLEGGARYLKMMYNQFGDWRLALAAYNAGPGRYDEHRATGRPLPAETRAYVAALAPVLGGTAPSDAPSRQPAPPPDWRAAPLFVQRPDGSQSTVAPSSDPQSGDLFAAASEPDHR